ncbi:glyceraldehyde 3-phosphate dehydrogenase NAD-binding domain-containing protein [Dactylosporangium sp. NPDC005572]|uniref:glyceraldehyde 3-phosphate dehydrogenase NAD-binding domain-containing protein n=1 Tax=Dactylosporangium sp. NPDC005572 TaxID=3156889 RepID=UPI0033B18516
MMSNRHELPAVDPRPPVTAPVRVAINGFGRIGRSVMRAALATPGVTIVAVNDLMPVALAAWLLRRDSTFGALRWNVTSVAGGLLVDGGRRTEVLNQPDRATLPWRDLGVDVIVEATRPRPDRRAAEAHLAAGARAVILPHFDADADATFVVGLNEDSYDPARHHVVSNGSCPVNCIGLVLDVLDGAFGVEAASSLTTHAYTTSQSLLDVSARSRLARAAALNIVPVEDPTVRHVGRVLPRLAGRVDGLVVRVPVPGGCLAGLAVRLRRAVTPGEVNAALRSSRFGALLEYSEAPLVSSDVLGSTASGIVDASLTRTVGPLCGVSAWFDNETAFAARTVDLCRTIGSSLRNSRG